VSRVFRLERPETRRLRQPLAASISIALDRSADTVIMSNRVEAGRRGPALVHFALLALMMAAPVSVRGQVTALTLPQNLSELVSQSQLVVQGWVRQVIVASHPTLRNLMTVVVTVQVEDTFKGSAPATYTFRQAVIDRRDLQNKLDYSAGEHVVLFLIKPSTYGLSSPAGLDQGRFRISQNKRGKLVAVNRVGNIGLFRAMPAEIQQDSSLKSATRNLLSKANPGPMDLQQLKTIVRAIASQEAR
jgi:hypothetical protein